MPGHLGFGHISTKTSSYFAERFGLLLFGFVLLKILDTIYLYFANREGGKGVVF